MAAWKKALGLFKRKTKTIPPGIHLDLHPCQTLHSRYEIVERLGQGRYSTVWLANDNKMGTRCAIKALTSEASAYQGLHTYELEVLQTLTKLSNRSCANVPRLLDHFRVEGDSDHLCLVTKVLGASLLDVQRTFDGRRVPTPLVQRVTRHILQALTCLHDANIVHTDIKQDNIMFDSYGAEAPDYLNVDVVLSDYGTATPERGDHRRKIQPVALRCPEALLGCEWTTKADIWNLGCIVRVFELLSGTTLFRPQPQERSDGAGTVTAAQCHFAYIYSHLCTDDENNGRLMKFFYLDGDRFDHFYALDPPKIKVLTSTRETLADVLRSYDLFTPEVHSFLMYMLRIHPDDRLTAKELLEHPWITM
ncbi:kinase-like protein [Pleurotus eryngii]|uniref:Kinase-like protein n=1 Tax=Pleurotus eryngii TaxID=5323 RepID=A0A9P5ZQA8_PLEER|nr:kinase-like protein [Pleurotus eryngii]